jgi:hypothetical protein
MTAESAVRLAVMEDDTVLCADCMQDIVDERLPATAATMVHAWLASPAGEACCWCGVTTEGEARS